MQEADAPGGGFQTAKAVLDSDLRKKNGTAYSSYAGSGGNAPPVRGVGLSRRPALPPHAQPKKQPGKGLSAILLQCFVFVTHG